MGGAQTPAWRMVRRQNCIRKGAAMSHVETDIRHGFASPSTSSWRELWLKEDWWAIWVGLGIVIIGYVFFVNGSSIKWIAVTPAKWSTLGQLGEHFAANVTRYLAQFIAWLAIFSLALTALGHKAREFVPAFVFLYACSIAIFALGQ